MVSALTTLGSDRVGSVGVGVGGVVRRVSVVLCLVYDTLAIRLVALAPARRLLLGC